MFNRLSGTSGRTRTATPVKAMDFESIVSTNFTTLAHYAYLLMAQTSLPKLEPIAAKPLNMLTLLRFALYQLPVEAQRYGLSIARDNLCAMLYTAFLFV